MLFPSTVLFVHLIVEVHQPGVVSFEGVSLRLFFVLLWFSFPLMGQVLHSLPHLWLKYIHGSPQLDSQTRSCGGSFTGQVPITIGLLAHNIYNYRTVSCTEKEVSGRKYLTIL